MSVTEARCPDCIVKAAEIAQLLKSIADAGLSHQKHVEILEVENLRLNEKIMELLEAVASTGGEKP